MPDHIAAETKNFRITIKRLIEVGVYLVVKFYILQGNQTQFLKRLPEIGTKRYKDKLDDFLDFYQN